MNKKERIGALVVAIALMLPGVSRAEVLEKSWEISPFVGYNWFETDQNLKDRTIIGGRVGYNFTRRFGLELALAYLDTELNDPEKIASQKGQFGTPHESVNITFYHIDAVFHIIPDGDFNPFLLAGFGAAHYRPSISVEEADMSAFNFGVGAKYAMTENLALRGDLQDNIVSEVFLEPYHNYSATLGVTFSFGGNEKEKRQVKSAFEPAPVRRSPVIIPVAEPESEKRVVAAAKQSKAQGKVVVLAFEDVHFDFDKATLTENARTIMRRNFEVLKENPKANVRVAGYTSASGTEEYNQKLSERRAASVRAFLVDEGIARPERLTEIGYGEKSPVEYESAPEKIYSKAAMANMRVLFEIIVE